MPYGIYHRLSTEELLEILPLRVFLKALPADFIPPGVLDPNYIPPYRGNELLITIIAMMCLVYPVVISRFVIRCKTVGMEADDWLMFAATIAFTIFTTLNLVSIYVGGMGYHSYDLNFYRCAVSYTMIQCITITYTLLIGLIRLSILFLIRRIFCKTNDMLRYITDTFIILVVAFILVSEAIYIFACTRVIASFDIRTRITANCSPPGVRLYIMSSLNIAFDVAILLLPAKSIWYLKSSLKDRVRWLLLFWMGAFACMCALFRLLAIGKLTRTQDIDYDAVPALIWGYTEASSAIIISCLPSLNTRIIKFFSIYFHWALSITPSNTLQRTSSNNTAEFHGPYTSQRRLSHYPHMETEFESDDTYELYLKRQSKACAC